MTGKDFWEADRGFDELIAQTRSADPLERWAAVFELGELGDIRAAERLRLLASDADEFVREAATAALTKLDPLLLQQLAHESSERAAASIRRLRRARSEGEMPKYTDWKTRPLPQPDGASQLFVQANVLEIVDVEGPVCGHRVIMLYGRCISLDQPSKLKSSHVKRAVEDLVASQRLCRSDDMTSEIGRAHV